MKKIIGRSRKGFVLVLSLLATSVLLAFVVPYVLRVVTDYGLTSKIYSSTAALDLAEAGAERALWEVGHNAAAFSGWNNSVDGLGNKTSTISASSFQTSMGNNMGDYDTTVFMPAAGTGATITSTGYAPRKSLPSGKRAITVTVNFANHNNFTRALSAVDPNGSITMSGQAYTNSYNSALGPYSLQPHTANGDIATNGAISLSGNAYINGNANPGADHPFSGMPPVSGSYGTLQAPIVVDSNPNSIMNDAKLTNSNSNIQKSSPTDPSPLNGYNLSITNSITLPAGTYYFTSINVSGTAQINIAGSVKIYVDGGNVSMTGQGIVNNDSPKNLLIYSTGSTINMSGQSEFTGAVYAPLATVKLTGMADVYGSIVCGSSIDSGQAAIHFDMDLINVNSGFSTTSMVTSWQEIQQ